MCQTFFDRMQSAGHTETSLLTALQHRMSQPPTRQAVHNWAAGRCCPARTETVNALCAILKCKATDLMREPVDPARLARHRLESAIYFLRTLLPVLEGDGKTYVREARRQMAELQKVLDGLAARRKEIGL